MLAPGGPSGPSRDPVRGHAGPRDGRWATSSTNETAALHSLGRVSDRNVSPDSGQHWAERGRLPGGAGVHRIPLPLPMDGLRAVNVYALETDDGLTLIDGGWAIEAPGRCSRSPSPSSAAAWATSPASWSPTCTATTTPRP